MVILTIGFQNTKAFLCGIWNLHREKLYSFGSSYLVLHSSINQCVVNGRYAMAAHSQNIYFIIIIIKYLH